MGLLFRPGNRLPFFLQHSILGSKLPKNRPSLEEGRFLVLFPLTSPRPTFRARKHNSKEDKINCPIALMTCGQLGYHVFRLYASLFLVKLYNTTTVCPTSSRPRLLLALNTN